MKTKKQNKKYFYSGIGLLVILILIFTIPKYFAEGLGENSKISSEVARIEIIHFHATSQCSSCITMGDMAEETVNTYFKDELKSGKINFSHTNGQLPENYGKVQQYGAAGSSLWIGTYYFDGTFLKEENINVWYKINNKTAYMDYFKGVVEAGLQNK